MSKPRDPDPEFKKHFAELLRKSGKRPIDFHEKAPIARRIKKSTFFRTQKGIRPGTEGARQFAQTFGCTIEEFLHPPLKLDWERSDVQQFLDQDHLLNIDIAIVLYRPLECDVGK